MDDLISRQAAIDALRTCYDTETISMDNGDEYINYGDAVGGIEQLPSAQPEVSLMTVKVIPDLEEMKRVVRKIKDSSVMILPSSESETCEGCKHLGKWENEVEYGYPSPCTCCKRRVKDNYER